jgi:uncharacterized protein (DUF697 family)/GTP-binding protein EngB required for normal cell division
MCTRRQVMSVRTQLTLDTDLVDIGELLKQKLEEALKKVGRVNVVIAGRSGVGKSTLINEVFQGRLATTGQGRPVTTEIREYTKEGVPLTIFDTRGLELDRYAETLQQLEELIVSRGRDADPMNHVHVAWLCISEDSRRVEEGESKVADMFSRHGVPVIAVITKVRSDNGFRAEVQRLLPTARNVARVRALGDQDDEGNLIKPKGLDDLVMATSEVVPEGQRTAFAAAQRVSLDLKKTRAHVVVMGAAATAAAIGAAPIPFSDAVLLVPVQVGMLASISAVFGLPVSKGFLSTLLGSAVTALGATFAGRAIVGGILKLLPALGWVAGGAISAATAAAMTTAFGETYIAALSALFAASPNELPGADDVAAAFKREITRRKAGS